MSRINTAPVTVSCIMAEEAQPFPDALPERAAAQVPTLLGTTYAWSLRLPDDKLIVMHSGIGFVAAMNALTTVLAQVRPSATVSARTTSGLDRQVEVGDMYASASLVFTDTDITAFGYARGQTPGRPETSAGDVALLEHLEQTGQEALHGAAASSGSARLRVGQILAGDSSVTTANVADIRRVFPTALSTDMESTALAQVVADASVPFISVRGMSDLCGPEVGQDSRVAVEEAATRSAAVVLALLG